LFEKFVYIELDNKYLFLSKLKSKKTKFILSSNKKIPLNETDFKEGILYNPSKIYLHIKEFIQKNKLKKARSIVTVSGVYNKNKLKQKLASLQIALCLSKTGLKIKHISEKSKDTENMIPPHFFYKKHFKDQLNFFKPFTPSKTSSPHKWLSYSSALILITAITSFTFYLDQKTKLEELNKTTQETCLENKTLENKLRLLHSFKQNIEKSNKNLAKLTQIKKLANNPTQKLVSLSESVPQDSWINNLSIDNHTKKIEITGTAQNEQTISGFTTKLAELTKSKELKIAQIKKLKRNKENTERLYQFKLLGQL